MNRRALLFALLPLLVLPLARAEGDAKPAKAPAPLQKVAVIGASISAGVGLDPAADPLQGQQSKLRLVHVVHASVVGEHAPPLDLSDYMFFSAPKPTAKRRAKEAADAKASVVVALDYLFWLGYGPGDAKARLERVQDGLKALEAVKAPLLLGDFADFNGVRSSMLSPDAVPPTEVIDQLNERIAEWAKDRKNVVVVPIREMFRKVIAGEPFEVRGNAFDANAKKRLMQDDGLHTSLEGTCALWVLAVDSWLATKPEGVDESAFVLDVAKLVAVAPSATVPDPKDKPVKPGTKPKSKAGAGG
jgi:hypothetical protein